VSLEPILHVEKLVKRFRAFRALDGISFDLRPGEVLNLHLEDIQYGRRRVLIRQSGSTVPARRASAAFRT